MSTFKTLTEEESKKVSAIKPKIYEAVAAKQMNEMVPCDKNNPANYGGVNFFFYHDSNGSYIMWDKHVNEWNEKAIMRDIYEQEHYIAKLKGLVD